MGKRARSWLEGLGDVFQALVSDPLLLTPALAVILLAALAGYLAWRFL